MVCPNCFYESNESDFCPNCNYDLNNMTSTYEKALPPFTILNGRFQLGRVLGHGGFGIAYIALDLLTQKKVAVKECVPDVYSRRDGEILVPLPGKETEFSGCMDYFLNERRILSELRNNPGVVNYLDGFSANNTEYFVMEYIEGATLKYLITKNGGVIPFGNCIYVLLIVGSALVDIHQKGIIHRDISPENIMITTDGSVKIIDFGTAKKLNGSFYENGVFLKPGFAPPEQYSISGNQGPWTDVYALGATLYTILSGQPLIASDLIADENSDIKMKSLYDLECGLPYNLSRVVERMMELSTSERYQSVSDVFNDLGEYIGYADDLAPELLKVVSIYKTAEARRTLNGSSLYSGVLYPYVVISKTGQKFKIPDYGFISLGKDPQSVDIVISDSSISRRHCLIGYDRAKNRFIVIDASTNGTFFSNSSRMLLNAETYLKPDETFFVCSEVYEIKVILE